MRYLIRDFGAVQGISGNQRCNFWPDKRNLRNLVLELEKVAERNHSIRADHHGT